MSKIRKLITVLILLVVVLLGYPLFVYTTSIHRAELPIEEVEQLASNYLNRIDFKIPIYLELPNALEHFIPTWQNVLDEELHANHPELDNFWGLELKRVASAEVNSDNDYIVKFEYKEAEDDKTTEGFLISPYNKEVKLILTQNVVNAKKVDDFLKRVLLDEMFSDEIEVMAELARKESKESDLVLPYSAHYNLVFSLMVENGKTVSWDIAKATELFEPIFKNLDHFANFTVSTQIQYYSTLSNEVLYDNDSKEYIIETEDLSTFINFGDWNLINHDMSPTINFLIYFPASNYDNIAMNIRNSSTNSFIVPQWGGVHIFNKKMPILQNHTCNISDDELYTSMEIFASQLFQLLGIPSHSKSPLLRYDKLSRVVMVKNTRNSLEKLQSLIKLAESLNGITIPDATKDYANKALQSIYESFNLSSKQNYKGAMKASSQSLDSSNKAFFAKQMVQQAYFPNEHKLAVFLPLLGPVGSIITLGSLKLLLEYIRDKKKLKTE